MNFIKKLTAVLTALMLVFALASCSSGSSDESGTAAEETTAASSAESTDAKQGEKFDLSSMTVGKITKISGNQVTLDLGTIDEESMSKPEMPSMADGEQPSKPDGEQPSMPDGEQPSKPDGEQPSMPDGEMPSMPEGGTMPEGMTPPEGGTMPEGATMPEGMSAPDGKAPGNGGSFEIRAKVNYTGETAKYTIPAEVKVGSGDYTSLTEGTAIGLTLDDDGIVTSVVIINTDEEGTTQNAG